MTTPADGSVALPIPTERHSLRDDLRRISITPIPTERVHAHIAADVRAIRPTLRLKVFGFVMNALRWCTLQPAFKWLLPRKDVVVHYAWALPTMLVLSVFIAPQLLHFGMGIWSGVALIPMVAFVTFISTTVLVNIVSDDDPVFEEAVNFWERHHPRSIWVDLPTNVQALVATLETALPDARLRVLAREKDSFLEVSRRGERHIVAAWDTEDSTLDFVPRVD